ncbi:MAG TPA: hypothetical protein VI321_04610 [Burkholderiales bacterium]
MSCCEKEAKAKAAEAGCCESKPQEKGAATSEQPRKSGCVCDSKEAPEKKQEKKEANCC